MLHVAREPVLDGATVKKTHLFSLKTADTEPDRLLFRLLLFASKSAPRRREMLNGNTCPADDALLGGGEGDRLLLSSSSRL